MTDYVLSARTSTRTVYVLELSTGGRLPKVMNPYLVLGAGKQVIQHLQALSYSIPVNLQNQFRLDNYNNCQNLAYVLKRAVYTTSPQSIPLPNPQTLHPSISELLKTL